MRISVVNWQTGPDDVDRTIAAILGPFLTPEKVTLSAHLRRKNRGGRSRISRSGW